MSAPIKLSDFIALSKKYEERGRTIAKLELSHASANRMNDQLMRENRRLRDELRELKAARRPA